LFQIGITIPILGGAGTLIASYLARSRGSGEPERSKEYAKEMGQFLRDVDAFLQDFGEDYVGENEKYLEARIHDFRERFEHLLGADEG